MPNSILSKGQYRRRMRALQTFSVLLITAVSLFQSLAMTTASWFVLNVNEYIPTARGGLWYYCYVSTGAVLTPGEYVCLRYEELPNFAVFINSRLYDSRVILMCSCGFCLLILTIEIVGLLILCCFSNSNESLTHVNSDIKPSGYFTYLAVSLITLVGSVMDFVLKVSGFALFDSYMTNLLSLNTGIII